MAAFIFGLITGLSCGFIGIYLAWSSGKDDRAKARLLADARARITQLEEEAKQLKYLDGFIPRISVAGTPPNNQFIAVTDSTEFRINNVDYLTADGLEVATQLVDRSGRGIQIPIDESKVSEVQKHGCDPSDGSFSMSFRICIAVGEVTKPFLLPVKVAVNSDVRLEPMPLGLPLRK